MRVIDISKWQKDDVLDKMNGHVQGVMIRVGHGTVIDAKFNHFYKRAVDLGYKIGYYWYYDSVTITGVKRETDLFLSLIAGLQCELPVAIDMEAHEFAYNANTLAITAGDMIEEQGYFCIMYSNKHYLQRVWGDEVIKRFGFWVAHWNQPLPYSKGQFGETCYMVQLGDRGGGEWYPYALDISVADDNLLSLVQKTAEARMKEITMEEICDTLMSLPNGEPHTFIFKRNGNKFILNKGGNNET